MRELLSGPWQRKQVSAMIGRMSRLNRTSACAAPAASSDKTPSPHGPSIHLLDEIASEGLSG